MTSPNTIIADMQAEIDALRKERDAISMIQSWISVKDRLPEPFNKHRSKFQGVLAFVKSENNIYGGHPMILFYGSFEFIDDSTDLDHPDADEDGMIRRFGWYYERDSEGEYDSLIFDMNDKVTHWMELPEYPSIDAAIAIAKYGAKC